MTAADGPGPSDERVVVHAGSGKRVREYALVLSARAVDHAIIRHGHQHLLVVPESLQARARDELEAYARENAGWPPPDDQPGPPARGALACVVYGALLSLIHHARHAGWGDLPWWSAGMTRAGDIQQGEWWRCLTALTLHDGLPHLAGNLLFGVVFGALACQLVGTGLAWCAILLAGAAGNGLNALIQPASHTSVGASTAVFGALGVVVAYRWRRRGHFAHNRLSRWAPLVMGLALLGFLGTGAGSEPGRVDVMAHGTGFGIGLLTGIGLAAWRHRRGLPGDRAQAMLAAVPPLVVAVAWWAAFRETTP